MPRLRYNNEWFSQLSLTTLPEAHFEDLLIQNSDMIKQDAWMTRFKRTIFSQDSAARADLAIIDQQYREWFIVEVEMRRHDLYGHVLPQVRTLRDGYYGPDEAAYLVRNLPILDHDRTNELIRGTSPKVVVIADRADAGWAGVLGGADIQFITIEIFKSELNRYIFSLDGGLPHRATDLVSYCFYNSMLPRQLQIQSPGALGVVHGQSLVVTYEGQAVEWSRIDTKDNCYLRTRGPIRLRAGARYALLRSEGGEILLKIIGSGG